MVGSILSFAILFCNKRVAENIPVLSGRPVLIVDCDTKTKYSCYILWNFFLWPGVENLLNSRC